MKRLMIALLMVLSLTGTPRAAEAGYNSSMAVDMMGAMWDFMEWFLGRRDPLLGANTLPWRYPNPVSSWYAPYGPADAPWGGGAQRGSDPYRYRDYWDDPANPWVDIQSLDGVWLTPSGEYWYVRGRQFVYRSGGDAFPGEFQLQGNFILARMPWGEIEFEFRQMDDVLVLRDIDGRVTLMRRIEPGGWLW